MIPPRPAAPNRPVVLELPCDRCGHWFLTAALSLVCQACMYAVRPYDVVLGYGRPTPLIRPVGGAA